MSLFTRDLTGTQQEYLRKLYLKNRLKMFHAALTVLKNRDDAEDAVQDAFLSLIKYVRKFDCYSEASMDALCMIITRNKCIDQLRKSQKIIFGDLEIFKFQPLYDEKSLEEDVVRGEESRELYRVVNLLPEIYREVIVLRYFYDFGVKRIAKLLNLPIKTVDSRLYRAKRMIRSEWKNET